VKLSLTAAALVLGASLIQAQVPFAAVDLLAGAGAHNSAGGVYEDDLVATFRLTTSIRLGSSASTRPVLKLEVEPRGASVASYGASGPYPFPPTGGVSYALGVSHVADPGFAFGAAVGGARYGGTYRGTRHNSVFGEADLAHQLVDHVSLTANVQHRQWVADGTRFRYTPLTIGLRLF
jgi:hypothetical protein